MINEEIKNKPYYQYAIDCINGTITCCRFVKQASERFIKDFERNDLEFREDKVNKAIEFISILKHFTGKSNGKNFILEPFQQFIIANLIGWYWKETDNRRFTSAYIEMGRKNGKTALIAALAMYYFIADGEANAEIDIAANNFQQATLCFNFLQQYSKQLDPKGKDLKVYRSSIKFDKTVSQINVFSSDDKGKDGFNASVGIIDEYHSAPNSRMRDVIKSSMGTRQNPMLLTITSAGFDLTLPCYQLRTTCTEILSGAKKDDTLFCIIYGLEENDDWTNPKNFLKSNPNLNITITEKYLKEMVTSAINSPTEEASTRTKLLGQWLQSTEIWIPDKYILDVTENIDMEDFKGCNCVIGLDLSSVSDMSALTYMLFKSDSDKPYFKTFYFLPESALSDSPNKELYKYWVQTNQLIITEGNVIDYDKIVNHIYSKFNFFTIHNIFYDPYNSTQLAIQLTDLGLPMEPYGQNLGNFNIPTKEYERLVRSKNCVIDNNEITRWMIRNVSLKFDFNGNCKPNKGLGKDKKIDGVISMLEALGGYLKNPIYSSSVISFI